MDAATLVTIITMFIVTNTSSEFIKYDGLGECLKDKREILSRYFKTKKFKL